MKKKTERQMTDWIENVEKKKIEEKKIEKSQFCIYSKHTRNISGDEKTIRV